MSIGINGYNANASGNPLTPGISTAAKGSERTSGVAAWRALGHLRCASLPALCCPSRRAWRISGPS